MVKKLQKMADKKKAAAATPFPAGLLDSDMAKNVKDSAQQIWAAGVASFAKAQGEGSKVFEALVSEGLKLQKKTQSAAEEKLSAVASKVSGMAGDVGSKAGQHSVVAVQDGIDRRRVGDHENDDVAGRRDLARTGGSVRAECLELLGGAGAAARHGERRAGLEKIVRHGLAHQAEPDETDLFHLETPPIRREPPRSLRTPRLI